MSEAKAATPVSDSDLLTILRARDYARSVVAQAGPMGLSDFHFGHSLIAESVALMFGTDIETGRSVASGVVEMLLDRVKQARAPDEREPAESSIIQFPGGMEPCSQ